MLYSPSEKTPGRVGQCRIQFTAFDGGGKEKGNREVGLYRKQRVPNIEKVRFASKVFGGASWKKRIDCHFCAPRGQESLLSGASFPGKGSTWVAETTELS